MRRFSGHEQAKQSARFEDWFSITDKLVESYLSMGFLKEAEAALEQMKQNFSRIPTDDWRNRYISELDRRYEYLKNAPQDNLRSALAAPASQVARASEQETAAEIISLRVRVEHLEQDLSQALHLFYCEIASIASLPASEFKQRTLAMLEAKFFQLPQCSSIGKALIDLDKQFGYPLEPHGINLQRWVYGPREKPEW